MSTYTYQPIDSSQGEIRILTVPFDAKATLGRANLGPLKGTLKNYLLPIATLPRAQRLLRASQLPFFNALSYVWGEDAKPQEIIIDGKSIPITQNLYDGLRALQKTAYGLVRVWADALCICQDDLAERSAQIMLMREIYHSASMVVIWLGPNSDEGRRTFKFIDSLTHADQIIDDPTATSDNKAEEFLWNTLGRPIGAVARGSFRMAHAMDQIEDTITPAGLDSKPRLASLCETPKKVKDEGDFIEIADLISRIFTQNDWFSRMWVVQEVGVASSVQFQLGGMEMYWHNVFDTMCYLHFTRGIPVKGIRRITGMQRIRSGWSERRRHPLQDLMRESRYRKATEPRDKIYSLLGLMGDHMNEYLQPDYSKSVGNVYSNVTCHFLAQMESLDPICGWQTLGRSKDSTWELPSWTPDYTLDQENAPAPLAPVDRRPSIYAAAGYDHRSKFQVRADLVHAAWRKLQTHGICIGSIARLSNPGQEEEKFGNKAIRWLSVLLSAQEFLRDLTDDVRNSLDHVCSIVLKYSSYHYSTNQSTFQFKSPKKIPILSENKILDAFTQTLLLGRLSSTERLAKVDIDELFNMNPLVAFSDSKDCEHLEKFCNAFEEGSKRRRLLVTENGFVGSAPQTAEEGDILCVLFGCSVPVILRKFQDEIFYEFVGECYLHDFMDAEAIALHIKGVLDEHEFVLM